MNYSLLVCFLCGEKGESQLISCDFGEHLEFAFHIYWPMGEIQYDNDCTGAPFLRHAIFFQVQK
jgi:hypothetical protein